jgi:hypothetical protein
MASRGERRRDGVGDADAGSPPTRDDPAVDRVSDRPCRFSTMEPMSKPLRSSGEAIAPLPGASGRAATKPPYEGGPNLSSANQGVDLGVFRKSAELLLGEFELSVDGDLENTSDSFDELHLLRTAFHKPRPRTEGPWFIVSRHAIFDSDLHSRHHRGEGNSLTLSRPVARRHCRLRSRSGVPTRLPGSELYVSSMIAFY